jgi:hypothetical protein
MPTAEQMLRCSFRARSLVDRYDIDVSSEITFDHDDALNSLIDELADRLLDRGTILRSRARDRYEVPR